MMRSYHLLVHVEFYLWSGCVRWEFLSQSKWDSVLDIVRKDPKRQQKLSNNKLRNTLGFSVPKCCVWWNSDIQSLLTATCAEVSTDINVWPWQWLMLDNLLEFFFLFFLGGGGWHFGETSWLLEQNRKKKKKDVKMPLDPYGISMEADGKNPLWLYWEQDWAILNAML